MRSMLTLSFLSLFAGIVTPGLAHADRERRQDRREVKQDRREASDDHFDYMKLRNLLTRFDQARSTNNIPMLQALENELNGLLAAELRESHQELAQDNREATRSQAEVGRDRRRGRRADDRRDRNDDVRDAQTEAMHLQQKRIIQHELASVAGRQDQPALTYRRERIVRLLGLGGQEIRENQAEQREDRREQREDRRPRR